MINTMSFGDYKAVINYDPEIEMFRGEFINLNGGADFYATDIKGLRNEGEISLNVFIDMCKKDNVSPLKEYSGKFNIRLDSALHSDLVAAAAAHNKSLNQFTVDVLANALKA